MSLRTPLGRALGLGSAKAGFGHWWSQRVSAAALVPLGLWFVLSIAGLPSTDYWAVAAWVGEPLHAILLILLLVSLLYHSSLGVQVIIEDYVRGAARISALVLVQFAHVVMAVAGIYAIVMLAAVGQ
ncbi:MAG: succinate dehydrogenase, hydrophobic membrane anchor protein [Gammaproteobacteria bacterium]|nr:MAG: succinate dehydrogenase, hydrophobic membrane anchor protein [Gammaproteobacteria bacterium]